MDLGFSEGQPRQPKTRILDTTSSNPTDYTQDTDFKTDESLLAARGITVIKHPEVFSLITITIMLFCPGTEREYLESLLPSKLWLLFGGPLAQSNFGNEGPLVLSLHSIVITYSIYVSHLVNINSTDKIEYK